jgi:hypothetical protein
MNTRGKVERRGAHLHRKHALGDELARTLPGDADVKDALALGINERNAFGAG